VLAVSGERRAPQLPDVPTVAEQGYPGFRTLTWNGYIAPAATPREIIERIAREIAAGCKDAAFVERLNKIGVDPVCSTPAEFQEVMRAALQFIETNSMAAVAEARITNALTDRVDPVMRGYFIDEVARNDKAAYVRAARAAFGFAVCERLGEIRAPTLVVVGDEDRVTPPMLSDTLASRIPGARLARIAGAGHISNIECAGEFNRVVLEFLESVER